MLSFIPAFLMFPIHFALQILNLGFWAALIIILGVIKFILPFKWVASLLSPMMHFMMFAFGVVSVKLIRLTNNVQWDCSVEGELSKDSWYLMMPNHLSYLDIILLIEFAASRIPAPKFFLKKELIWLPFVGLGAWALGMPFMQRYSREFVEKNPHLKGKDIETTRRYCKKFQSTPTTVINFVEGSRFTPEKQRAKSSQYQHLLPPKAGGVAFTLAAMGDQFTNILNVTILYPENNQHPMMDMLCGNLTRIVVHIDVLPVADDVIGDYFNDAEFKGRFQIWLNDLWASKDKFISQLGSSK
ncbi:MULTISPECIES: acyltransferase [Alteromonadaceae]|uniref:acyltransferase n=1 Tax=Alteromonadaceae TaxID=72275 RepID=UPI001C08ED38|nr:MULTISPECIES: acyltransferase [Aliiglaciecola]MBU2878641.1 acyltransferase [Aliiglaciecola lipolytica]MDO6709530.1 acyltransferase [Aliiglaciecola sp. 2_MG-2023]MDO6750928.1 acyltransferase [Aliiglaciecola sp. 1_MG-2023]